MASTVPKLMPYFAPSPSWREREALWFDARGMTPLAARLFASPLIGLGLGMALVSRWADWREIMIPAVGMVTIGVLATLALVLSRKHFAPQSPLAWFVAVLPSILLLIGLVLLRSRPRPSALRDGLAFLAGALIVLGLA